MVLAIVVCAAGLGALRLRRSGSGDNSDLVALLPTKNAIVFYVNAAELRDAGVLKWIAGSKAAEEADYRKFVSDAGFDYRTDLDAAAGALQGDARYFALRGRFQWPRLTDYATAQGGECHNSVCTMPGSERDRNISFNLLKKDVLAVAVAKDPRAVANISLPPQDAAPVPEIKRPVEPVWISMPRSRLASVAGITGMAALFAPLAQAREITLAASQNISQKTGQANQFQIRLTVESGSEKDAARMTEQLQNSVKALGTAAAPNSLGHWLAQGSFAQHAASVDGIWQVERAVLERLVADTAP